MSSIGRAPGSIGLAAPTRPGLRAMNRLRTTTNLSAALLLCTAGLACGSDGGGPDLTEPPDVETPEPEQPGFPAIGPLQGDTVWALDLHNRLLVFGSESSGAVSRVTPIRGVAIFHRIIGIDVRPSDGRLYGVGNDSRVYVIDPYASTATPVRQQPFSPSISAFFDIHFGMAFDPATDKILLISADFNVSWIIDPDDGTAVAGEAPRYVEGDAHEGRTPALAGLAFGPPPGGASARASGTPLCDKVLYALDSELAWLMGSCDPDYIDWESLFEIPGITVTACAEIKHDGAGGLWASLIDVVQNVNKLAKIDPETGAVEWQDDVPVDSPIQAIVFGVGKAITGTPAATRTRGYAVREGASAAAESAAAAAAKGAPGLVEACQG